MHAIPIYEGLKYPYFLFVNVVTMPSIDSNNLRLLYLSLSVINNWPEIETGVRLRQICSLNIRRLTEYKLTHDSVYITKELQLLQVAKDCP